MKSQAIPTISVIYQAIESLRPYSRNARTHSKHQIRQIAASIKEFGFNSPVLVDGDNRRQNF